VNICEERLVRALYVVERAPHGYAARLHGRTKREIGVEHFEDG